jgi:hypothetical protein
MSMHNIWKLYNVRALLELEHSFRDDLDRLGADFYDFLRKQGSRGHPEAAAAGRLGDYLFNAERHWFLIDTSNPTSTSCILPDEYALSVVKIQYGSPGVKDLAGWGEVVGHLKDFLLKLIDLATSHRRRTLEDDKLEEEIRRKRIENAGALVNLAKDLGYTKAQTQKLVDFVYQAQEPLLSLAEEGKIHSVKIYN